MDIQEVNKKLKASGVNAQLYEVKLSEEEEIELRGWRKTLEQEGQELWRIYNWLLSNQNGSTHGIYRIRQWLEDFNVPDNTNGKCWK